jgi:hypothetical protein
MKHKKNYLIALLVAVAVFGVTVAAEEKYTAAFQLFLPNVMRSEITPGAETPDPCIIPPYPAATGVVCPTYDPYPAPGTPEPSVTPGPGREKVFLPWVRK